jgi:hypothetical protein
MTEKINQFFSACLLLPYRSNSQDNPHHERQVGELLDQFKLTYQYQPNGSQNSPDYRVVDKDGNKVVDIECKSSKGVYPVYNGGLPKPGVVYIFSSSKYNRTTIFFADDIISVKRREEFARRIVLCEEILNAPYSDTDGPDRGIGLYFRKMYTHLGGSVKYDYFTHPDRSSCEQRVINFTFPSCHQLKKETHTLQNPILLETAS